MSETLIVNDNAYDEKTHPDCTLCGCSDCPYELECQRKQQTVEFIPCPACGCFGKHRFCLTGYQAAIAEGEESRNMDLGKFHSGQSKGKDGKKFKRLDFFKAKNLPKKGTLAVTFTSDAREATGGFSDLLFDIRAGKKEFVLGLNKDSVLLGQLIEALGKNSAKWKGKSVKLYLAKEKYINVDQK